MSTDLTQPLGAFVRSVSGKTTRNATPMEFWQGLSSLVVDVIADAWHATDADRMNWGAAPPTSRRNSSWVAPCSTT